MMALPCGNNEVDETVSIAESMGDDAVAGFLNRREVSVPRCAPAAPRSCPPQQYPFGGASTVVGGRAG
jgi:hypothetical protein